MVGRIEIGCRMQIPLGLTSFAGSNQKTKQMLTWDSRYVVNGHMLITGYSGTGKTTMLRHIIESMSSTYQPSRRTPQPLRFHIFDVHDDINPPAHIPCSEIMISESAHFGLNPLELVEDQHSGGVRKSIQNFISIINKTSRILGERQESVLRSLMAELYKANGFDANNPSSWNLNGTDWRGKSKKYPTMTDLYNYIASKYRQMTIGGNKECTAKLEDLNKAVFAFQKKGGQEWAAAREEQHKVPVHQVKVSATPELRELADKSVEAYKQFVGSLTDGTGDELRNFLKYDSRATIKSVMDRILNLKETGIFGNGGLPFDESKPIWRYRIKHVGEDEKKMFVYFRLKELFDAALLRGEQDTVCEVIIIDEAKKFIDNEPDNIITKMINEIRKFGTMVICSSQSLTHFNDDLMTSTATKIILGVSDLDVEKTARKILVKKEAIQMVSPRKNALIQVKQNLPQHDPTADFQGRWQLVDVARNIVR